MNEAPSSNGPRWLIVALASGFGTGYAPVASGTFGTLVGIPLAIALAPAGPWAWTLAAVLVTLGACWVAGRAEGVFGEKDSGKIVIDEIAGYLVSMAFLPATAGHLALAFFLFRLFDVLKPPPARQWERTLPGGFGVVMDDIAAGVWANVAHRLVWVAGAWLAS
ncbi:MAG: phosphatidylglycerophosphatase A [bacterium]